MQLLNEQEKARVHLVPVGNLQPTAWKGLDQVCDKDARWGSRHTRRRNRRGIGREPLGRGPAADLRGGRGPRGVLAAEEKSTTEARVVEASQYRVSQSYD